MSSFVVIEGNLTAPPEFHVSDNGIATARFTIMVNDRYRDKDNQWVSGPGVGYDVVVWRSQAENLANSDLTSKNVLLVTGELTIQGWKDKDGNDRSSRRVAARTVSHSFARHTVTAAKVERSTTVPAADASDPWAAEEPSF